MNANEVIGIVNLTDKTSKYIYTVNFGHAKIKVKAKYLKLESDMDTIEVKSVNGTVELIHYEHICYCANDYVATYYPFSSDNGNIDIDNNDIPLDIDVPVNIEIELKPDIKRITESITKDELVEDIFDIIVTVNGVQKRFGLSTTDIATRFKVYVQGMESDSLEVTKYISVH